MPKFLPAGVHDRELFVATSRRRYRVVVPDTAAGRSEQRPLLMLLHAGRTHAERFEQLTGFSALAAREGCVVVYPQGTGPSATELTWNAGRCCGPAQERGVDDIGFLTALIEKLPRWVAFDRSRVAVVGMSNGGMMAQSLAIAQPKLAVAVASVAGPLMTEAATIPPGPDFLLIHGTADPMIPFEGGVGPQALQAVPFRSVAETIAAWTAAHTATQQASETLPNPTDEPTTIRITRYRDAQAARDRVVLWTIEGGGHTWPGHPPPAGSPAGACTRAMDATQVIWEFCRERFGL